MREKASFPFEQGRGQKENNAKSRSEPKGFKIGLVGIGQHFFVATAVAKGRHIILLAMGPHRLYTAHLFGAVAVGGSETAREASRSINLNLCAQHNDRQ